MRIPGKRVKRTRLVRTERYVVAVEVDLVIPLDAPMEPCYEAETIAYLREVADHAERGDVGWLRERGRVYRAIDAA